MDEYQVIVAPRGTSEELSPEVAIVRALERYLDAGYELGTIVDVTVWPDARYVNLFVELDERPEQETINGCTLVDKLGPVEE